MSGSDGGSRRTPTPDVASFLEAVSRRCYYSLSQQERRLAVTLPGKLGFTIDGWSFTTHPDVLGGLPMAQGVERRIIAIETLRAKIYFAVRGFLEARTVNVNSYFTGGSADFICDVSQRKDAYECFSGDLMDTLVGAGAGMLEDVKNLVSVFRVEKALVLCGKEIERLEKPHPGAVKLVLQDLARFERVYRDYRSAEAKRACGSEKKLRQYLTDLEEGGVIIGFHARLDHCRYVDREYVPLCNGVKQLRVHLSKRRLEPLAILEPTIALFQVQPDQPTDETERLVSHIFINEYKWPGQRNEWRCAVYESLGDELNVFTFPLEGTVNESPLILSDYPEAIEDAGAYSGPMCLGRPFHPSDEQSGRTIGLFPTGLAFQGITLGQAGQGKTNTDCVLLAEALPHLRRIIVIDGSSSIREKEAAFPPAVKGRIHYHGGEGAVQTPKDAAAVVKLCTQDLNVIEAPGAASSLVFDACLEEIDRSGTNTANAARVVEVLLMVEEVNEVLGEGSERERRVTLLKNVLQRAFRKGWCIWLSAQQPIHVGHDDPSALAILRLLHNRIIHRVEKPDVDLIVRAIGLTGVEHHDRRLKGVGELDAYTALVSATRSDADHMMTLPPVTTRIRKLSDSGATGTAAPRGGKK